jgi:transposase
MELPRRRYQSHSAEFKAKVIDACRHPGVSIASVALDHRINANMLRTWISKAGGLGPRKSSSAVTPAFVPVKMPAPVAAIGEIAIDIIRGAAKVQVRWPIQASSDCAAWLRELLR